jgi:hypothetical protein
MSDLNGEAVEDREMIIESGVLEQSTEDDIVDLGLGEDLSLADCLPITRANPTRVVILAGEVGSGKTTLLATVYEYFQGGPYADHAFAGSVTLLAFERCCHDARIISGRNKEATERTKHKGEYRFLHLKLKNLTTTTCQDVLFTDVSGELFRELRDSTDECKQHTIISRADHFVLLVDGERIVNPITRGKAVSDATSLLRQCIDAGVLSDKSYIDIVFTKMDHLSVAINTSGDFKAYFEDIVNNKFLLQFGPKVGKLDINYVSARVDASLNSGLVRGHGLIPLFKRWILEGPTSRIFKNDECKIVKTLPRREIDKFYFRF